MDSELFCSCFKIFSVLVYGFFKQPGSFWGMRGPPYSTSAKEAEHEVVGQNLLESNHPNEAVVLKAQTTEVRSLSFDPLSQSKQ